MCFMRISYFAKTYIIKLDMKFTFHFPFFSPGSIIQFMLLIYESYEITI